MIKQKTALPEILLIAGLILLAGLSRLVTNELQLWNFTAIGASALFGGIMIKNRRLAYIVPVVTLFLTDLCFELFTNINGFYGGAMFFVYGAFLLITWIGTRMKKVNALTVFLAAVGTGVLFFLVTNFGTWLLGNMYPHTFSGLMACFAAGIPFFRNDLFGSFFLNIILGNIFYSALLFGAYALVKRFAFRQQQLA
ncbi:DUF6580 family putative transport protein [Chitinophaga japonensis]|uniref:Energy-coupling factor transport system substrate-specific component n=1 Tax=Chitinophaga japonensis TaxID=104662 RepID=A0A562SYZ2_CHIJA|nr:DUF6580 family putative transport protein [Chitinophaga japonensis]TWI86511.1 hypothetical protein LX66_3769 [Chitinophaga japonensis]